MVSNLEIGKFGIVTFGLAGRQVSRDNIAPLALALALALAQSLGSAQPRAPSEQGLCKIIGRKICKPICIQVFKRLTGGQIFLIARPAELAKATRASARDTLASSTSVLLALSCGLRVHQAGLQVSATGRLLARNLLCAGYLPQIRGEEIELSQRLRDGQMTGKRALKLQLECYC